MITGKDLVTLGYKPGKWFNVAIKHINDNNLSGEELAAYMSELVPVYIEPHDNPIFFHKNILAQTKEEIDNVNSITSSMNEIMKIPTVVNGAVMPDACPTGPSQIPVGGIVVTKNAIHPAMHSADICCSVMMSDLGIVSPKLVLDAAHSITHFGPGGRKEYSTLPKEFIDKLKENKFLNSERSLMLASSHMATQGDGNHFYFVGISKKTGNTIIVTHHGSRGFGANLYSIGLKVAEKFRRELSPKSSPKNSWIPAESLEGNIYWEALQLVENGQK